MLKSITKTDLFELLFMLDGTFKIKNLNEESVIWIDECFTEKEYAILENILNYSTMEQDEIFNSLFNKFYYMKCYTRNSTGKDHKNGKL